jgi:hypothetical protein
MWELPLYFKDANGNRDTLYFGIDTTATTQFDTLFEDPNINYDTVNFQVLLAGGRGGSTGKRLVVPPNDSGQLFAIIVNNAYKGIDIEIDLNKLADSSNGIKNLIWDKQQQTYVPDKYVGSALWMEIGNQFSNNLACGFAETVAIVGGSPDLPATKPEPVCHRAVGMIGLVAHFTNAGLFSATFISELKPMNVLGSEVIGVGINEILTDNIKVFPNPIYSHLWLESNSTEQMDVTILNSLGVEVMQLKLNAFETVKTDFTALTSGFYIIELRSLKGSSYKRVLKK